MDIRDLLQITLPIIQAPMAGLNRILPVVRGPLGIRALDERNVTTQLVAQLEAIAELHVGEVPLRGRLFSQWLHYVFPYECPYPRKSDTAVSSVLSEYSNRTGLPSVLIEQEMKKFIEENRVEGDEQEQEPVITGEQRPSLWSMEEELYVGYHHQGPRAGGRDSCARLLHFSGARRRALANSRT